MSRGRSKRKTITFERCYGASYTLKPLADGRWAAWYMPDPFDASTSRVKHAPVYATSARSAADELMQAVGRTLCPWNYLDAHAYKTGASMYGPSAEIKENNMAGLRGGGTRRRKTARKTASLTMATIKANNKAAGQHWFSKDTLRFFSSRVGSKLFKGTRCVFFVTSEEGPRGGRKFSVRKTCDRGGRIQTVGDFQAYATRAQAEGAAKRLAKQS